MKQVLQSFKTGDLLVADVPPPQLRPCGILVRTAASLVSAGTERMVVDFAEKNLIQKAQARPDLARQVIDKMQREGILNTLESVRSRFEQALPLGYSSAGVVVAVGAEAGNYTVGDRVACAGSGYASHAEQVYVPRNMAARVPPVVSLEAAAFTTIGAVAMHGVRLADAALGHQVLVIGLGLIGQLTVQLLKAAGCRVMGVDLNPRRVELALQTGAHEACTAAEVMSRGLNFTASRGFDAIIITADTKSSEPVETAGALARDRAVIVAVGAVGMNIPRKIYYEKELDFRISRSYGPGRYDPAYEDKGQDYPVGYVRWTQQRNMAAFTQLLADGALQVEPLITHRFTIDDAAAAYDVITGKTGEDFLGVILTYEGERPLSQRIEIRSVEPPVGTGSICLGLVGAGSFANNALLPAIQNVEGLELRGVMSGSGLGARQSADRFGFAYCTSSFDELLADSAINWIAIATRHDLHAAQAQAAMKAGKNVYVEKPLTLDYESLVAVMRVQHSTGRSLTVGFNRRFAPMAAEMRAFLGPHQRPLLASYRINAGHIPANHWTQDPLVGGGRIIGEACHFIDLLQFLIGSLPVSVYAAAAQTSSTLTADEVIAVFTFADGSAGTVIYAAGGDKAFGKERIEIIGDGKVAVLDDFRHLELTGGGRRKRQRERLRPNKGHRQEWEALAAASREGRGVFIPLKEIAAAHLAAFAAVESVRRRQPVPIDLAAFWADVHST